MLNPEEKAISMFNSALKVAINLGLEPKKESAKEIVLNNLLMIKECLYDATLICSLNSSQLKQSFEYYEKIRQVIENL